MGLYEQIRDVAKSKGYSINRLEKELGFARSSINKFNKNTPSTEKIQQIAEFLGVSVDTLLHGSGNADNTLTERDRRDISKDLDRIMEEILNNENGPLFYKEKEIPENKVYLLRNAIEVALEDAKINNKETYKPYKYKPRPKKE